MKQEEKELLLKDICGRLPYGVKVRTSVGGEIRNDKEQLNFAQLSLFEAGHEDIKPYLFPLSSMTEEQKKEYNFWKHEVPVCHYEYGDVVEEVELFDSPESFEYLIENHFDYRGLIEKGLAIDATNKNIY